MKNKALLFEIWDFVKAKKLYWLIPVLLILLLVGILIIFGQSTALSSLIYPLI